MRLSEIDSKSLLPSIYQNGEFNDEFICTAFDRFLREMADRVRTFRGHGSDAFYCMTEEEQLQFLKDCGIDWFFSDMSELNRAEFCDYVATHLEVLCKKSSLEYLLKFVFNNNQIQAEIVKAEGSGRCNYTILVNVSSQQGYQWSNAIIARIKQYVQQFWPVHTTWDNRLRVTVAETWGPLVVYPVRPEGVSWREFSNFVELKEQFNCYFNSSRTTLVTVGANSGVNVATLFNGDGQMGRATTFNFRNDSSVEFYNLLAYDANLNEISPVDLSVFYDSTADPAGKLAVNLINHTSSTITVRRISFQTREKASPYFIAYARSGQYQPANVTLNAGQTQNIYAPGATVWPITYFEPYHKTTPTLAVQSVRNNAGTTVSANFTLEWALVTTTYSTAGFYYAKAKNIGTTSVTWSNLTGQLNPSV